MERSVSPNSISAKVSSPQRIGIIGGGRGGRSILDLFLHSHSAQVCYVVDPNPTAPALVQAKHEGIPTYTSIPTALTHHSVDYVFEVTGQAAVAHEVAQHLEGSPTVLIPNAVARLLVQVLDETSAEVRREVSLAVGTIQGEISHSLEGSKKLVGEINRIMSNMQMLALNASIEAAKVGIHGKGFAVVADHMTKSVESVRRLTQEIESVNEKISNVSKQIETVLEKLK